MHHKRRIYKQILYKKSSALCRIAWDHGPELSRTARDHDPGQHSVGPHIFVYISANLQQNSKIFYSMNQGPRWVCLMKKPKGQKSHDTVPLSNVIMALEIVSFKTITVYKNSGSITAKSIFGHYKTNLEVLQVTKL
jgi:hypothetical protein